MTPASNTGGYCTLTLLSLGKLTWCYLLRICCGVAECWGFVGTRVFLWLSPRLHSNQCHSQSAPFPTWPRPTLSWQLLPDMRESHVTGLPEWYRGSVFTNRKKPSRSHGWKNCSFLQKNVETFPELLTQSTLTSVELSLWTSEIVGSYHPHCSCTLQALCFFFVKSSQSLQAHSDHTSLYCMG